jgi:hypothetical protein
MALANSIPQVRPNLTNNVFLMGATTSGQTGGANQVTVAIPGHRHSVDTLNVTGQGMVSITGATGGVNAGSGLANHRHWMLIVNTDFQIANFGNPFSGPTEPNFAIWRQTEPPDTVAHTHSLSGSVVLNGLDVGGTIGSGQFGDNGMNAAPHENRPAFLSAIYLVRVN